MRESIQRRRSPRGAPSKATRPRPEKAGATNATSRDEKSHSPASAFWITDYNFERVVYVSRGYELLWGRTCASLYANPRSLFDAVHPNDRNRVMENYSRQQQGVALDLEYRIIRPDGTIRWVWDRRSPMGDAAEPVYAGAAQDITERKLAEQVLVRHSSVVQSSSEAIISTTLEGVITAWNPAAEALFGYSGKEATGASIMMIAADGQADDEARLLERVARGEEIGILEVQRRHRNGALLDVALTISPLREGGKVIVGAVVMCRDITREKAMRSALLESERCFRETFEATPVGIAHVSVEGQIVRVNRKLCEITGFSREALLEQTLRNLADPDDRGIDAVQLGDLLMGKIDSYSIEKRLARRNDFPIWTRLNVAAAQRISGVPSYLIVAVQDISGDRDVAAQLRQAQKMETIGQLASGVAHDFNNVLGYVTMRAELTSTYPDLPANALADLQQIKAAANRATHLTRQLLSFSRNEHASRPQRIDVNELIQSTIKMIERLLGENIALDVRLHPRPITVNLDPGIVDQVLLNLAVNARDAMSDGGLLTIETSEFVVPDRESRPSPEIAPGAYVCLRVTDTGTGIAPENVPHIFEAFFTTKQPGRGTGLGLAMVSSLIHQQRGWITVKSELGRGTTFNVFLPAVDASAAAVVSDATPSGLPKGSETILLVEDEADLRVTARMVLQLAGYKVLEAATGAEAIESWAKHHDEIDLIFTDMVLPDGVSGRALAAHAQTDKPDVKLIYTTGYSPDVAGREITLHDGKNFLPKPYSIERLLNVMRQSLAK